MKTDITRYIVAFNGDVTDTVTADTTHILCKEDDSSANMQVHYIIIVCEMTFTATYKL